MADWTSLPDEILCVICKITCNLVLLASHGATSISMAHAIPPQTEKINSTATSWYSVVGLADGGKGFENKLYEIDRIPKALHAYPCVGLAGEDQRSTGTWRERFLAWKEILRNEKLAEQVDSLNAKYVVDFDMQEVDKSLRKDVVEKVSNRQGSRALWISKRWWRYRPKLPYTYFLHKLDCSEVAAVVFSEDLKKLYITIKEGFPIEYVPVGDASETKSMYKEVVLEGDVWELVDELMIYMGNPMQYYEKEVPFVRGVLLSGPPGTGKTLFARTLAKESGMPFVFASGAEFTDSEKSGAARINEIFSIARRNAPSFVFLDAIAGRHARKDPCRRATFEALIAQLDGEYVLQSFLKLH